jgi:hypothetical protein
MTEPSASLLVVGIVVQILFTLGLAAWGRSIARKHEGSTFYRFASYAPWGAFALIAVGTILGVVMLGQIFRAVAAVSPSERQRILAAGISETMNVSATFLLPGYALLIFAIIAFVMGSLAKPRTE